MAVGNPFDDLVPRAAPVQNAQDEAGALPKSLGFDAFGTPLPGTMVEGFGVGSLPGAVPAMGGQPVAPVPQPGGFEDPQQYVELAKGVIPGAIRSAGTAVSAPDVYAAGAQSGAAERVRERLAMLERAERGEAISPQEDVAGYAQMSPDQRARARDGLNRIIQQQWVASPTPVQDRPFFKMGEAIQDYAKGVLPPVPGYDRAFGRQVGEGLGSVAFGLPIAALTGPVGGLAVFSSMGVGEATQRAVEFDRRERAAGRSGLSQDQITTAGLLGVGPGSTDLLPVEVLLGRLPLPIPQALRRPIAQAIGRVGIQAAIEGVQEGGQGFLQDLIAREVYNPNQQLGEQFRDEAAVGAAVGGLTEVLRQVGTGMVRSAAGRRGGSSAPATTPEVSAQPQERREPTLEWPAPPAFETPPAATPEATAATPAPRQRRRQPQAAPPATEANAFADLVPANQNTRVEDQPWVADLARSMTEPAKEPATDLGSGAETVSNPTGSAVSQPDNKPAETVTLYRGEGVGAEADPLRPERAGRWWTVDPASARGYAGPGGSVYAIDVPLSEAARLNQSRENPNDFVVPPELRADRRVIEQLDALADAQDGLRSDVRDMRGVSLTRQPQSQSRGGWEIGQPMRMVTPDGSMQIDAVPMVVDYAKLKPATGDLQPRNRKNRPEYRQIIRQNAKNYNIDLGMVPNATPDRGAPTVTGQNIVLAGNGRVETVKELYSQPHLAFKAAEIRSYMTQLEPSAARMKMPGIVMVVPQMAHAQQVRFADLANRSVIAEMGRTENSKRDAANIGAEGFSLYQGGDLNSPENQRFRNFVLDTAPRNGRTPVVTTAELNTMSRDGVLSQEGRSRIEAALLAAAYPNYQLLSSMLESTDTQIKSIAKGMLNAAPVMARLGAAIDTGQASKDLDPRPTLVEAIREINSLRQPGQPNQAVASWLAQSDAFDDKAPVKAWVKAFYYERGDGGLNQHTSDLVAMLLNGYANEAMGHIDASADMFGGVTPSQVIGQQSADVEAERQRRLARRQGNDDTETGDIFSANQTVGQGVRQGRNADGRRTDDPSVQGSGEILAAIGAAPSRIEWEAREILNDARSLETEMKRNGASPAEIADTFNKRYGAAVTAEQVETGDVWWRYLKGEQAFVDSIDPSNLGGGLPDAVIEARIADLPTDGVAPGSIDLNARPSEPAKARGLAEQRDTASPGPKLTPELRDMALAMAERGMAPKDIAGRLTKQFGQYVRPALVEQAVAQVRGEADASRRSQLAAERRLAFHQSPEQRQIRSERMRRLMERPGYREEQSERMRQTMARPEMQEWLKERGRQLAREKGRTVWTPGMVERLGQPDLRAKTSAEIRTVLSKEFPDDSVNLTADAVRQKRAELGYQYDGDRYLSSSPLTDGMRARLATPEYRNLTTDQAAAALKAEFGDAASRVTPVTIKSLRARNPNLAHTGRRGTPKGFQWSVEADNRLAALIDEAPNFNERAVILNAEFGGGLTPKAVQRRWEKIKNAVLRQQGEEPMFAVGGWTPKDLIDFIRGKTDADTAGTATERSRPNRPSGQVAAEQPGTGQTGSASNGGVDAGGQYRRDGSFSVQGFTGRIIPTTPNPKGLRQVYVYLHPPKVTWPFVANPVTALRNLDHSGPIHMAKAKVSEVEPGVWQVQSLNVKPKYVLKGLGTEFLDAVQQQLGGEIIAPDTMTPEAYAMWNAWERQGDIIPGAITSITNYVEHNGKYYSPNALRVEQRQAAVLANTATKAEDRNKFRRAYNELSDLVEKLPPEDDGILAAITAYHGSPHDFDKPSLSRVRDDQVEAHGVFVTSRPDYAGTYGSKVYELDISQLDPARVRGWDDPVPADQLSSFGVKENPYPRAPIKTWGDLYRAVTWRHVAVDPNAPMERGLPLSQQGLNQDALRSEFTRRGVDAFRYRDAAVGDGWNHVILDDSLIKIVAKDGKPVTPQQRDDILAAHAGPDAAIGSTQTGTIPDEAARQRAREALKTWWPTDDRLYIDRDLDGLIGAGKVVTGQANVPVADIKSIQNEISVARVRKSLSDIAYGLPIYPIEVAIAKDGTPFVLDGHHRWYAAKLAGVPELAANVRDASTGGLRLPADDGSAFFAASSGLDMSPEARKARAEAMGFDTSRVWYRGVSGMHALRPYSMWTTSPGEASAYSQGVALTNTGDNANVMPAYMKRGNGRNIDPEIEEALFETEEDPDVVAKDIIDSEGLDWVEFHHPSVSHDDDHVVRVVKSPSSARSINAAFDPAQEASANLMAAVNGEIGAKRDAAMRARAAQSFANGKVVRIEPEVVAEALDRIEQFAGMFPPGTPVGTVESIAPYKNFPTAGMVRVTFKLADGSKAYSNQRWSSIAGVRNGLWPATTDDGRSVGVVSFFRFDFTGYTSQVFRGELGHENVHALCRGGHLSDFIIGRLARHSDDLRVMDMGLMSFMEATGHPNARLAVDNESLAKIYNRLYAGQPDIKERIAQEKVAHLTELYNAGAVDVDPEIAVILDAILDGSIWRVPQGDAAQGEMELVGAAQASQSPSNMELQREKAEAAGFDTSVNYWHGTGRDLTETGFDLRKAQDKEGRRRGVGLGKGKVYLDANREGGNSWAMAAKDRGLGDRPNVVGPLWVRGPLIDETDYKAEFERISGGRPITDSTLDMAERDRLIAATDKAVKAQGYKGIQTVYRNRDGSVAELGQTAMFNTSDIRHVNADFDQERSGSSDLMAAAQKAKTRLAALHNLSAENLAFADKMGGIAVPSIGVVKEGMGMGHGFGEITMIGQKSLGDPSQNPVYDADAWSIRFPRPDYKAVSTSKAQPLMDALRPYGIKFDDTGPAQETWDAMVNRPNPESAIRPMLRSKAAQAMFLDKVKGKTVEPVMRSAMVGSRFPWIDTAAFKAFLKAAPKDWSYSEPENEAATRQMLGQAISDAIDEYVASKNMTTDGRTLDDEDKAHFRELYRDHAVTDDNQPMINTWSLQQDVDKIGKKAVDSAKTRERLERAIKPFEAEFKTWAENQIVPLYGEPRIKVNGRFEPYTLENITRVMTAPRSVTAQEDHMTFGEGKARAAAASRIGSVEEARTRADWQMADEKSVNEAREKAKALMEEWRNAVVPYNKYVRANSGQSGSFGSTFEALDGSMRAMAAWAKRGGGASGLRSALAREDFVGVPADVLELGLEAGKAFMEAPVPYFESKPQRVVKLNEFAGAVIPKNASPETRDILDKNGIPYREYDSRKEDAKDKIAAKFTQDLAKQGKDTLFAIQRQRLRDQDTLGYYSHALEVARDLKQSRGTPEQMLAQLKSAGVKDAEIEATGLRGFLDGKKSITRDEIVAHLEANRVGLRESNYGFDRSGTTAADTFARLMDYDINAETTRSGQGMFDIIEQLKGREIDIPNSSAVGYKFPDGSIIRITEDQWAVEGQRSTKWSSYSIDPSNPTYRETVLHLPDTEKRLYAWEWFDPATQRSATYDTEENARRAAPPGAVVQPKETMTLNAGFRSGHFPEPNIIGHMMTSMVKHEGQPVYLIDQIQSDWGQKLRDGGVRDEGKIARLRSEIEALKISQEAQEALYQRNYNLDEAISKLVYELRNGFDGPNTKSALAELTKMKNLEPQQASEIARLRAELETAQAATPGNPLVNTTDQWTTTTLRRALRQAAEADAAYIAIPSGDTVLSYNPGDEGGMRGFYGATQVRSADEYNKLKADLKDAEWEYNQALASQTEVRKRNAERTTPNSATELKTARKDVDDTAAKVDAIFKRLKVIEKASDRLIDGIVPKNLRKILEKLDKDSAKPIKVDELETPSGMKGNGFTLFPLTPKIKADVMERGQAMFAFGGERAKTADMDALARAKQLEADGSTRDQIWTDTGWFRGVDGKWRFEIDDSGAGSPVPMRQWIERRNGVPMAPSAGGAYASAMEARGGDGMLQLRNLLQHDGLSSAYPDIMAYSAGLLREGSGARGTFNPTRNTFGFNEALAPKEFKSTALHEGTHAIQKDEGFDGGSNLAIAKQTPEYAKALADLSARKDPTGMDAWTNVDVTTPQSLADSVYRRFAGEVEARAVQKRMDMTADERRARPPWLDYDVPEDQQIVRFGATGPALSFGTITSPGADINAYTTAIIMAKRGASPKEIWDATNWFKRNGQWLYETDEPDEIKTVADARIHAERQRMTPDQRRATPPWETPVPQAARRASGGSVEVPKLDTDSIEQAMAIIRRASMK